MVPNPSPALRILAVAYFLTSCTLFIACSSGYHTDQVIGGTKVDQGDLTTGLLNSDKTEQPDQQGRAPKRQPNDPIYVSLAPPVLDENMQQAEKTKGVMAERIRYEFAADPIIKLVESDLTQSGLMKPHSAAPPDVEVSSKVSLKEAYGLDQKTGKPTKVLAVVFEATITSQVPPATYNVSELGYAVRNQEVSKRFAKQVRQVILEKIGPVLPAH